MRHTLLGIDDVGLPMRKNVCLHMGRPTVRAEPVLSPSPRQSNAPDNLAAHFYGTVLHDGGLFRMWYYACHRGKNPDWSPRLMQQVAKTPGWLIGVASGQEIYQGPLCYAQSDDGIHWTKPDLGQVLFKGSRHHNALALPHTLVSGAAVIRDDDDPDSSRRYKMVYQFFPDQCDPPIAELGTRPTIACAVSPDGLRWTLTAVPFVNGFVEHCSLIKHGGQYIVHSQAFPGKPWGGGIYTEGGSAGGRSGVAHVSDDFDHWPDLCQRAFALPEPADPAQRGTDKLYDQTHLGVGAASLGNVCVGLYGIWHNQPFGPDFAKVTCDLGLLISNDGIRFREPGESPARPFIHHDDSPASTVPGHAFRTVLCQGNGILNVGRETRIYHGRWRNVGQNAAVIAEHYHAEVALATLPRDRWGALGLVPDTAAGTIVSAPLTLPTEPATLSLNADGLAGLSIDLLDEHLRPIPGFTAGQAQPPDGLDCPVRWPTHDLATLAGRRVRVQVKLSRTADPPPRVFAVYVDTAR